MPILTDINLTLPENLTIPKLASSKKLNISWCNNNTLGKIQQIKYLNAESDLTDVNIDYAKILSDNSSKTVYEFRLGFCTSKFDYEPGDTIGIICQNISSEVYEILERIGCSDYKNDFISVSYLKPIMNLHGNSPYQYQLIDLLTNIYDIRAIPKKSFLCTLAQVTKDSKEKLRLLQLCSKEGAKDYEVTIRNTNISLLHILRAFPTCKPTLENLLENLPPLQPRAYSISNSPYEIHNKITFVFTLIQIPSDEYFPQKRFGLCTGYLANLAKDLNKQSHKLTIFKRSNPSFKLPSFQSLLTSSPEHKTLLIYLAPGVGIAPFLAFFQHLTLPKSPYSKTTFRDKVDCWLYHGCRNYNQDFIYR
ncbi:unnamed protein product, partial [Gordionus sp. m RMFG-2023]